MATIIMINNERSVILSAEEDGKRSRKSAKSLSILDPDPEIDDGISEINERRTRKLDRLSGRNKASAPSSAAPTPNEQRRRYKSSISSTLESDSEEMTANSSSSAASTLSSSFHGSLNGGQTSSREAESGEEKGHQRNRWSSNGQAGDREVSELNECDGEKEEEIDGNLEDQSESKSARDEDEADGEGRKLRGQRGVQNPLETPFSSLAINTNGLPEVQNENAYCSMNRGGNNNVRSPIKPKRSPPPPQIRAASSTAKSQYREHVFRSWVPAFDEAETPSISILGDLRDFPELLSNSASLSSKSPTNRGGNP